MREAVKETRKNGAVGIDGQTGNEVGENLNENLSKLLEEAKGGTH